MKNLAYIALDFEHEIMTAELWNMYTAFQRFSWGWKWSNRSSCTITHWLSGSFSFCIYNHHNHNSPLFSLLIIFLSFWMNTLSICKWSKLGMWRGLGGYKPAPQRSKGSQACINVFKTKNKKKFHTGHVINDVLANHNARLRDVNAT